MRQGMINSDNMKIMKLSYVLQKKTAFTAK